MIYLPCTNTLCRVDGILHQGYVSTNNSAVFQAYWSNFLVFTASSQVIISRMTANRLINASLNPVISDVRVGLEQKSSRCITVICSSSVLHYINLYTKFWINFFCVSLIGRVSAFVLQHLKGKLYEICKTHSINLMRACSGNIPIFTAIFIDRYIPNKI